MIIKEIEAKSILRKHKKIDSWFISPYGMNLYRGCAHNCVYCDGRAEKYQVEGEFGTEVAVKINAIDLLKKELNPKIKRQPLKSGYIGIGGGVGDSYQPVEEKYQLTRQALQLLADFNYPVFVLSKSTLVERDIDVLTKIKEQNKVIIAFSFSSSEEKICSIFEPAVPSPTERLKTLEKFKKLGFACGMYLMPVIPFISDTPEKIEETIRAAKNAGIDFIIFSGMTLKEGRQSDYFFNVLNKYYPALIKKYQAIYKGSPWGEAAGEYYNSIRLVFYQLIKEYHIPPRIPLHLYHDILAENDLVIVLLEHIDYLLKLKGRSSPFGFAAYSISKVNQPLSSMKGELTKLKGVGKTTERIILEILATGRSSYYDSLFSEI